MTATMNNMELVWADKLTPGSLMVDDMIKVDGDLITVTKIDLIQQAIIILLNITMHMVNKIQLQLHTIHMLIYMSI